MSLKIKSIVLTKDKYIDLVMTKGEKLKKILGRGDNKFLGIEL